MALDDSLQTNWTSTDRAQGMPAPGRPTDGPRRLHWTGDGRKVVQRRTGGRGHPIQERSSRASGALLHAPATPHAIVCKLSLQFGAQFATPCSSASYCNLNWAISPRSFRSPYCDVHSPFKPAIHDRFVSTEDHSFRPTAAAGALNLISWVSVSYRCSQVRYFLSFSAYMSYFPLSVD